MKRKNLLLTAMTLSLLIVSSFSSNSSSINKLPLKKLKTETYQNVDYNAFAIRLAGGGH